MAKPREKKTTRKATRKTTRKTGEDRDIFAIPRKKDTHGFANKSKIRQKRIERGKRVTGKFSDLSDDEKREAIDHVVEAAKKDARSGKRGPANISKGVNIELDPPNYVRARFTLECETPLVSSKFGGPKLQDWIDGMGGDEPHQDPVSTPKNPKKKAVRKPKRGPKDLQKEFEHSTYRLGDGSPGIPAASIRNAMLEWVNDLNYKKFLCKRTLFVEADGWDMDDLTPLIRMPVEPRPFTKGVRQLRRTPNGVETIPDVRCRPYWAVGTTFDIVIQYDADWLSLSDVTNLLWRAVYSNGICEGRPGSSKSNGCDWGRLTIKGTAVHLKDAS